MNPKEERREHGREDTTSNPKQPAARPDASGRFEPGEKPPQRPSHTERGPGSAAADVGMTADGGRQDDNTLARPNQRPEAEKP
jgi:hypothetical protein